MAGENVSKIEDAGKDKGGGSDDTEGRQRSSIAFPYDDLAAAIELGQAIYNNVGLGDCEDDQLASWTNQSQKSSGYRTQIAAARLFGVIDTSGGRYRLSELGRLIVDPQRTREGRVRAFLNVPLFNAVFEKYRGGALPPAGAFERDLETIGVAPKMKDRARRVLERSAEQAGFFEQGRNRLVRPGVAVRDDVPPPDSNANDDDEQGGGGGGGKTPPPSGPALHPFIQGLLLKLPEPETEWEPAQRVKWLQTAANIFDLIYKGEGGIEVSSATAGRSPRPRD